MSGFSEYDQYDALGLAELVKKGEVGPKDLLDEAIRRRDAVNPKINAIIHNMDQLAYDAIDAGLPNGPFQGVPFLLKDLLAAYKGVPMSHGSRAYKDYIPNYDAEMVVRFKRAGLVIFGKTSCPENGYLGATEPKLFGITRNPWDLDRTPGGSSGGSAAAVGARIVPMASGGDGGGSLRIPASCCGLVGLKASRGRNPNGPYGEPWFGQEQEGVMSISVRDSAAALDATSGPDMGCPYSAPPPQRPFLEEVTTAPGKLKIAWSDEPLMRSGSIGDECRDALHRCVEQLRELGHELVEAAPPLDKQVLGEGYAMRMMCTAAADLRQAEYNLGRPLQKSEFERETWMLARCGEALSSGTLELVRRNLDQQRYKFERFMQGYDIYLTPTLSKPPVPHGEYLFHGLEKFASRVARRSTLAPVLRKANPKMLTGLVRKNFDWVAAPSAFNITGNPSISLPLQWSNEGLPIGMMFTARYLDEARLFQLAGQLEQAYPWANKRPPLAAY